MSALIADGYFFDDHLVWGNLGRGGILSRGYRIQFQIIARPMMTPSSSLRTISARSWAPVRETNGCNCNSIQSSDYESALARYERETKKAAPGRTVAIREELSERYRARMEEETLLRTECRLHLSTKLGRLATETGKCVRGFEYLFQVVERSFAQRAQFFELLLESSGGSVEALTNVGHLRDLMGYWSPGQLAFQAPDADAVDWLRTIESLCRFSDAAPREEPEHGLFIDGHYFGVWVMKTMPRSTWAHTMDAFFALSIPGLRVIVNMEPLSVEKELQHEEDRYSKLMSNLDAKNPSLQSEVGLEKHREPARRLMSNKVLPFKAQVLAVVHDRTRDGLDSKMEAVRAAMGKTGAEPYRPVLPTSTLAYYLKKRKRFHYRHRRESRIARKQGPSLKIGGGRKKKS